MLWIVLGIVYGFIILIALFGDYEEKAHQKEYEYYNKIINRNLKWWER